MTRPRSVSGTRRCQIDSGWEFSPATAGLAPDQLDQLDWKPAVAPNTAAGALRDLKAWDWDSKVDFDASDWWWRVRLEGANAPSGSAVLGFDGLATLADVWLDGEHLLSSDNMFVAHQIPVELHGSHDLLIRCAALAPELAKKRPRPRWRVPMLVHAQLRWFRTSLLGRMPGWSPPCPAVGPWRPVWVEQSALTIGKTDLRNHVEGDKGVVDVSLELGEGVTAARLIIEGESQSASGELSLRDGRWCGRAEIAAVRLWWPHTHGEPVRYRVSVEALQDGESANIDFGHTGFRTIEIEREHGDFALRVNGVDVFCRGACWTPLDVVKLAGTPQALREAMDQVCTAGMNMLRVSGAMVYEDDAFLDALDERGVLLWQDLMFANMDYPEDEAFVAGVLHEVDQQLERLQARPSLALICGNSEVEQQAAMSAAGRELWAPPIFHQTLAAQVEALGIPYVTSSAQGGAFPHAANAGTSSYYGVGAYLRPLEDARRSGLVFASECLAFANIPHDSGLPAGSALRVHHAAWKARSPRDLGAGWDFDDVRDHYVGRLYGVDPVMLRTIDHERYVELGRAVTGEVMAQAFAEWRRARSPARGALIWFLRDLWPGAGWGVLDAHGIPKPSYYALGRALAPVAMSVSDEGVNGLLIHLINDQAMPLSGVINVVLYHDGEVVVGRGTCDVVVPAHAAIDVAATDLFDGFLDLSFAYRFGPAGSNVLHAVLIVGDSVRAEAHWFAQGQPGTRERDVGLRAVAVPDEGSDDYRLTVECSRFAQSVAIDAPGFTADDGWFHLLPGQPRVVSLRRDEGRAAAKRGTIVALNAEARARFDLTPLTPLTP
ncbi:MAG TPA: glycoside hydrolase family 2 protein [Rhodanobacter sp.]|nr:glycoside hydrolase family 2 protein [Rhodanobacter sp.]